MADYVEMFVRPGGSNLNAGTLDGGGTEVSTSPLATYTGSYVQATGVLTADSGDPVADGVQVDQYAAIDTGGSTAARIARITARTTTTITLSLTDGAGTNPANGSYTLRVSGAWAGPSGASGFPFTFVSRDIGSSFSPRRFPRINFKDTSPYEISANISVASIVGPIFFQGYSSVPGDGGRGVIQGPETGAAFQLMTLQTTSPDLILDSFVFQRNGDSGSANGLQTLAARSLLRRIVARDIRTNGIQSNSQTSVPQEIEECEAYNCNLSGTNLGGGFSFSGTGRHTARRLVSHHHIKGVSAAGGVGMAVSLSDGLIIDDPLIFANEGAGIHLLTNGSLALRGGTIDNNGKSGLAIAQGTTRTIIIVENTQFLRNGEYAIDGAGSVGFIARVRGCGFGRGTMANVLGDFNGASLSTSLFVEEDSVIYSDDHHPCVDPSVGNYTTRLGSEAVGNGYAAWLQVAPGFEGPTTSAVDIGASQAAVGGVGWQTIIQNIGTH